MDELWLACPCCGADVCVKVDMRTGEVVEIESRECSDNPYGLLCVLADRELLKELNNGD